MNVPLVTFTLMAARVALVALIQLVDAVVRQVHVPVAQVLCRIRISAHQFQAFTIVTCNELNLHPKALQIYATVTTFCIVHMATSEALGMFSVALSLDNFSQ